MDAKSENSLKYEVLSMLWEDHKAKEKRYLAAPELLSDYKKQFKNFVMRRTKVIKEFGEDPKNYSFKEIFKEEYNKNLKKEMDEFWKKKLDHLHSSHQEFASPSHLYQHILAKVSEKSIMRLRNASSSSSRSSCSPIRSPSMSPSHNYKRRRSRSKSHKYRKYSRRESSYSRSRDSYRKEPFKPSQHYSSSDYSHSSSNSRSRSRSQSSSKDMEKCPYTNAGKSSSPSQSPLTRKFTPLEAKDQNELEALYEVKKSLLSQLKDSSTDINEENPDNFSTNQENENVPRLSSLKFPPMDHIKDISIKKYEIKKPFHIPLENLIPQDIQFPSPKKTFNHNAHNFNNIDEIISHLVQHEPKGAQEMNETQDIVASILPLQPIPHSEFFSNFLPDIKDVPHSQTDDVTLAQLIDLFSSLKAQADDCGPLSLLIDVLHNFLCKVRLDNDDLSRLLHTPDFLLAINLIQDHLSSISLSKNCYSLKSKIAAFDEILNSSKCNIPRFFYGIDLQMLYNSTKLLSMEKKKLFIKSFIKFEKIGDSLSIVDEILDRLKFFE